MLSAAERGEKSGEEMREDQQRVRSWCCGAAINADHRQRDLSYFNTPALPFRSPADLAVQPKSLIISPGGLQPFKQTKTGFFLNTHTHTHTHTEFQFDSLAPLDNKDCSNYISANMIMAMLHRCVIRADQKSQCNQVSLSHSSLHLLLCGSHSLLALISSCTREKLAYISSVHPSSFKIPLIG